MQAVRQPCACTTAFPTGTGTGLPGTGAGALEASAGLQGRRVAKPLSGPGPLQHAPVWVLLCKKVTICMEH
jgi:hypothetical protein